MERIKSYCVCWFACTLSVCLDHVSWFVCVFVCLLVQFSNIQVSRRYKHFDWLQKRLVEKYSTIAIPPLPEKQIAGTQGHMLPYSILNLICDAKQCWLDESKTS